MGAKKRAGGPMHLFTNLCARATAFDAYAQHSQSRLTFATVYRCFLNLALSPITQNNGLVEAESWWSLHELFIKPTYSFKASYRHILLFTFPRRLADTLFILVPICVSYDFDNSELHLPTKGDLFGARAASHELDVI